MLKGVLKGGLRGALKLRGLKGEAAYGGGLGAFWGGLKGGPPRGGVRGGGPHLQTYSLSHQEKAFQNRLLSISNSNNNRKQ